MRILTFNWHEPYLCAVAKTGHRFEIVEQDKGGSRVWFYETRPLPPTATIVSEQTARYRARHGAYDVILCHNLKDLGWAQDYGCPRIVVFHNMLATEIALNALAGNALDRDAFRSEVIAALAASPDLSLVFISDRKQKDWDLPGYVITPGIDLDEYGGYAGHEARVLRVGNFIRRRDVMLGYSAQMEILGDRPSTLLGLNEPELNGRFTRSWDDLKDCFRSHRAYLNSTVEGFEDGYNLAMLEAMATGMPVVSTANATSPLIDGVNGFVSDDRAYLSARLDELLQDDALARRLGAEARATVGRVFPMASFVRKWNAVFEKTVLGSGFRVPGSGFQVPGSASEVQGSAARKKILLAYVSYPATTARYLEAALRREHDVLTLGPAIDDDIIKAWKLEKMGEPIVPHDLPCGYRVTDAEIRALLPDGWTPDLFLWIESVPGYLPRGIPRLDCPTACYLIDSHLNLPLHLEWAPRFDDVFLAQREYIADFHRAGCRRVTWLPLACDPDVHGRQKTPKRHKIGFVGSVTPNNPRRSALLERLSRRFPVHVERSFFREMSRTFSASKIVFNDAVRNDLNMRVFEALCSGSMLLTDRAPASGLDEMFVDGTHLVIYDDEERLEQLAAHYLGHDGEREAIAARGREEVLRWHTYDHRAAALLDAVFGPARDVIEPTPGPTPDFLIQDALVEDVAALSARGEHAPALARASLAARGRELSPGDRLRLDQAAAASHAALGETSRAEARLRQARARFARGPEADALIAILTS